MSMKHTEKLVYGLDEVEAVAQKLVRYLDTHQIMTFAGPLGAGKTTLIQTLLRACGITQPITSPTFTYLNQYENDQGKTFYHFDLYRIPSLNDFLAAGFDEYLYVPDSRVLIEWPQVIMPLLTHVVCQVTLEYHEQQDKRVLSIA